MVMPLNNQFLCKVLNSAEVLQGEVSNCRGFSVDSRTIKKDEVFIALKGASVDGHNFLEVALENGASGLIVDKNSRHLLEKINKKRLDNKFILLLDNVLESLLKLAASWRKEFDFPIIAITGSIGKTSTKDMLSNILSLAGKKFFVSKGNQNTLVGLILNLLQLREDYEGAIFELGISKRGEMDNLVSILRPTGGVITALAHCHLSGLGSINDISVEKRQIFKFFKENNIGVINGDQKQLVSISYKHPVMKFGLKTTNQIQARKIKIDEEGLSFILKLYNKKYNLKVHAFNEKYIYNYLAAAAVATLLDVPDEVIVKALQRPLRVKGRFELKKMLNDWGTLIDDCYNANPESVKASLLGFEKLEVKGKKIFVFSDMLELGQDSAFWHRQIGRVLHNALSVDRLILVGNDVKWTLKTIPVTMKAEIVNTWQEAVKILESILVKDSMVLVKGSTHGYKSGLVNLVDYFTVKDSVEDIPLFAAKAVKDDLILGRKVKNL
jgi:UDP-N-acetylmuramoyl-tripeptide--D-alanyl-D-alanine ligase